MDSQNIIQNIASAIDQSTASVENMLRAFAKILSDGASTLTSVAVPSFGSFVPVKYEEEIRPDLSSGKKMLFPPAIVIEFHPATSLRKKLPTKDE